VLVGTTALLHRSIPWQPDLLVVDEQQKFSREQREQLMGENTNLLESTATCIPRTMALARYGVIHVSKLTRCHCKKTIYTKIWLKPEWKQLYEQAMRTLSHGDQIMLVYPLREKAEVQDKEGNSKTASLSHLRSASEIYEIWNARFPGQVRLLHGQMENELKREVLDDLRSSKASIAICTSISEIGLTIPNLRRVIVVHPERHGLITLHQIRGRLARHGGEGYFDLFLPYPLKAEAFERLRVLEMTCNGFEVSELDMRLRGVGDLSHASDKQSGSDETFLFGRSVRLSLLDEAMRIAESAFAG
jgi:ATP-dependent DNA helicase RecG